MLAYNLGNLWRAARAAPPNQELAVDELAAPADEDGRSTCQACSHYWLLLAEAHLNRRLFGDMLHRIWALPLPSG